MLKTKNTLNYNKEEAPLASKIPFERISHGHKRVDNYQWLENRDHPDVLSYLHAENDFTQKVLEPTKPLQEEIFTELKGRIESEDESVAFRKGNFFYQKKYEKDSEYYDIWRYRIYDEGEKEKILDGNKLGSESEFFQLGGWQISRDEKYLAYAIDRVGRRNYTICIKNLDTKEVEFCEIHDCESWSFEWGSTNDEIYYLQRNETTLLAEKLIRYSISEKSKEVIYEEADNRFYMELDSSICDTYLKLECYHIGTTSEVFLLQKAKPQLGLNSFYPREEGHEYNLEYAEGRFWIKSNKSTSDSFNIYTATHESCPWELWWAAPKDGLIENFIVLKEYLCLEWRQNGNIDLKVFNKASKAQHNIPFEDPCYVVNLGVNLFYESSTLRFQFSSLTTPSSTLEYKFSSKSKKLLKQTKVKGNFNSGNYRSQRVFAKGEDGTLVPASLVYHKNTQLNGSAPLLQYAYGSYGISIDPYFSSSRLSLLDRGFVFAIAHVRGGQEMGRKWYKTGKLKFKMNTFLDFYSVTKFLIENKIVDSRNVFAQGGSAGGLLMGVLSNKFASIYKAIIADVPFVDVVSTMLDDTIPLTTGEYNEWGDPRNLNDYSYMMTYSPYDNVSKQKYPWMLVTSGYHDSQVQYWEPTKWVAKLRTCNTADTGTLLFTEMKAGHGGATGRFNSLKQIALKFAFLVAMCE